MSSELSQEIPAEALRLLEVIRKRRSIRVFLPKPVPDEYVKLIVEAGRWAPSGANSQPCEFIVIKKPEIRARLAALLEEMGAWEKKMEAKHVDRSKGEVVFPVNSFVYARSVPVWIAVVADPRAKRLSIHVGDDSEERIYRQSIGMAIQNMWLMATALGLATVDVTIRKIQPELKALLGVPDPLEVTDLLPIGYTNQKREKDRRPLEEVLHFDRYDVSKMRDEEWFDRYRRDLKLLAYMSFGRLVGASNS